MRWDTLANDETIHKTIAALNANGIDALVVDNGDEARGVVLKMLPKNSEVMTMRPVTLDTIGVSKEINESGNYDSVRNTLNRLDKNTQRREIQQTGAAPEWTVGSVHAVTEDGKVLYCFIHRQPIVCIRIRIFSRHLGCRNAKDCQ